MKRSRPVLKTALLLLLLSASIAFGASNEIAAPEEGPISPMEAYLLCGILILVLVGIGIVLAGVVFACCALLASLGIVSSSVVVGLLRGRFSSGLRTFHYQVCAALTLPVGIAALGVWQHFFDPQLQVWQAIVVGALTGTCAGLLIAWILDRLAVFACRRLAGFVALPSQA